MNALVAFEAVARLGSFLRAAEDLNVTPGAVSRQVKNLEQFLGTELFVRLHRRIALTPAGQSYHATVSKSFGAIRAQTDELLARNVDHPLRIVCPASFLRHWLLPRLVQFNDAYPRIGVTFASGHSWDPSPEGTDLRIMLGPASEANLVSSRLVDAGFVPVCTPQYLGQHPPLACVQDLTRHTLLHSALRIGDWERWLGEMAVPILSGARVISLRGDGLAHAAALEGVGIALGRICFVAPDLLSGRLVLPLPILPQPPDAYYLVWHRSAAGHIGLLRFRAWIDSQARASVVELKRALREMGLA